MGFLPMLTALLSRLRRSEAATRLRASEAATGGQAGGQAPTLSSPRSAKALRGGESEEERESGALNTLPEDPGTASFTPMLMHPVSLPKKFGMDTVQNGRTQTS